MPYYASHYTCHYIYRVRLLGYCNGCNGKLHISVYKKIDKYINDNIINYKRIQKKYIKTIASLPLQPLQHQPESLHSKGLSLCNGKQLFLLRFPLQPLQIDFDKGFHKDFGKGYGKNFKVLLRDMWR